jgi:hypothetical protein
MIICQQPWMLLRLHVVDAVLIALTITSVVVVLVPIVQDTWQALRG